MDTRQAKQAEALTWLTLIIGQRTATHYIRDRALQLQDKLTAALPADVVAVAVARGRELTLAQAVDDVLGDAAPQVMLAASPKHRPR